MKDSYDLSKMKRVPHPLQKKIDSGELKLINPFDIPDEEFEEKIKHLDEYMRETVIIMRQRRIEKQLVQKISEVEESCSAQLPQEVVSLLDEIKIHLTKNPLSIIANKA